MTNVIDFTMFINQINAIDGHLWNLKKNVQLSASVINKAIRDGRPRPPRHQGFIAISYGGVRTSTPFDLGNYNA